MKFIYQTQEDKDELMRGVRSAAVAVCCLIHLIFNHC